MHPTGRNSCLVITQNKKSTLFRPSPPTPLRSDKFLKTRFAAGFFPSQLRRKDGSQNVLHGLYLSHTQSVSRAPKRRVYCSCGTTDNIEQKQACLLIYSKHTQKKKKDLFFTN